MIFLDTGYHFAETYAYRDRLAEEWDLNLVNVLPALTVAEQESQFGILNQTAPDRCCAMRKVGPLFASLEPYRPMVHWASPGAGKDPRKSASGGCIFVT